MPELRRESNRLPMPGPYIGFVKGTADVNRMGRLDVFIPELQDQWDNNDDTPLSERTITVEYCSPFAGQTPYVDTSDKGGFGATQKSYGFWMVPPDVETKVLVMFAGGNINNGYWIGCIPEIGVNHMTPGIAASPVNKTLQKKTGPGGGDAAGKYSSLPGVEFIPVAEPNKRRSKNVIKTNSSYEEDKSVFARATHDYHADELVKQGLLPDPIRGTTTSSARRETPSQVFGISTPGPIDPKGNSVPLRESGNRHAITEDGNTLIHSRLGGHTFVMDDGTPPKHDGSKFTTNIENELVRIRTRSGAQILLHNSEDIVYIINNSGDAWIELSANGKIDAYANDSISFHTNTDFNFRAERDVNIEAGRNVNVKATGTNKEDKAINSAEDAVTGRIHMDAREDIEMIAELDIKAKAGVDIEMFAVKDIGVHSGEQFNLETGTDIHMRANDDFELFVTDNASLEIGSEDSTGPGGTARGDLQIRVKNDHKLFTGNDYKRYITGDHLLEAAGDDKIYAANHWANVTGEIHFNTSGKVSAGVVGSSLLPAGIVGVQGERVPSDVVVPLTTFLNVGVDPLYPEEERLSIMKRVPTAEPYAEHENKKTFRTDQTRTDREIEIEQRFEEESTATSVPNPGGR